MRGAAALAGARALVLGLGLSGTAAATLLHSAGADVRAFEPATGAAADTRARAVAGLGVEVVRDGTPAALLRDRDLVVPSPGVAPHTPVLTAALERGLPVWSEPELGWRAAGGDLRLIAVTGTNGKTTTTELIATCLGTPAGGNLGQPLATLLPSLAPGSTVVAELSSFQLRFTSRLAPVVALVLNLAPDHLDWHGSFVAYAAAKAKAWAAQGAGDLAVVNGDDREARGLLEAFPPPGRSGTFDAVGRPDGRALAFVRGSTLWAGDRDRAVPVLAVDELGLEGMHNLANASAAVAAAAAAGADPGGLAGALRAFRAGPHRLERVALVRGVAYVNDSKATNPHAAAAALAAFPSVVWIAGGLGKGLTFDGLGPLLAGRVRAAVTIGAAGPAIAEVARRAGVPVVEAGELDAAVAQAARLARPGDTVLLAPACASLDQFSDYAARGQAFRALVAGLQLAEARA